jgi:hypothetical protein
VAALETGMVAKATASVANMANNRMRPGIEILLLIQHGISKGYVFNVEQFVCFFVCFGLPPSEHGWTRYGNS